MRKNTLSLFFLILVSVNRINAPAALPEKVDAVIAEDPLAQSECNNKVSSKRSGDLKAQDHLVLTNTMKAPLPANLVKPASEGPQCKCLASSSEKALDLESQDHVSLLFPEDDRAVYGKLMSPTF
ncbi:hypothetical protein PCANC_16532 [Puccinia coronata f. sp. avenae]|uniref:Uncharacterized protein n=1 Tax=Puccinia coronata f. sp. avenae TaxID=200324 RepID=A0A2N5ULF8_9BASI|nr:hypothetical protein PCANC_16532 [Puccinia coronata f. sp. avenae]